jgi:hypothetical protein
VRVSVAVCVRSNVLMRGIVYNVGSLYLIVKFIKDIEGWYEDGPLIALSNLMLVKLDCFRNLCILHDV